MLTSLAAMAGVATLVLQAPSAWLDHAMDEVASESFGGTAYVESSIAVEASMLQPAEAERGWSAVFQASGGSRVRIVEPHAAFVLKPGESTHPSIAGAGLKATYSAQIDIPADGRYRFGATVRGGDVKVSVFDGKGKRLGEITAKSEGDRDATAMTEAIQLPSGSAMMSVQFTRAGDASARLRTLWQKEGVGEGSFPAESLPQAQVSVPPASKAEASIGVQARHGRMLLGELGCTHCHTPSAMKAAAGHGDHAHGAAGHDHASHADDPSILPYTAPVLGQIGARAEPGWLLKWVADPQAIKPGSPMPDVFGDTPQDLAQAEAIVHFLVSMGGGPGVAPQPVATESTVLSEGRDLFHSVGCIACHGALETPSKVFDDPSLPTTMPTYHAPRAFGKLGGKWRVSELSSFLREPSKWRPAGRMPSLNLSQAEADYLANYLVTQWNMADAGSGAAPAAAANEFKLDPAKIEIGKAAFTAKGCANCHELGAGRDAIAGTLRAKSLSELAKGGANPKGCLSETPGAAPRYTISQADRAALATGIQALAALPSVASSPIDATHRAVEAMNCRACHEYNGAGGWSTDLKPYARADEGAEPSDEGLLPPRLTGVGVKLTTTWLERVLQHGGRARPYMHTRMPQFGYKIASGGPVGMFHEHLAAMDGIVPNTDEVDPVSTDAMTVAGKQLVGEKGMNCISCHVFGESPPAGTRGPDLTQFSERLRYEWFKPYLLNPTRFKPGTRMSDFYPTPDGLGVSKIVFDGNADKQIEAVWSYFNLGELFMPVPEGVPSGKGIMLQVADKPVIFRTFIKDAGSRAIAVGYPSGMNFAFDAAQSRLASAWLGAFLDASGAWAGRGGEEAGGQGPALWNAPDGPPIVIAPELKEWPTETGHKAGYQFKGYSLDKEGTPSFRYSIATPAGVSQVLETFGPFARKHRPDSKSFHRVFVVLKVPEGSKVWVRKDAKGVFSINGNGRADESGPFIAVEPEDREQPLIFQLEINS